MIKQITEGDVRVVWQNDPNGKYATLSWLYKEKHVRSKKIPMGLRYEPTSQEMIDWLKLAKDNLLTKQDE